SEMTATSVLRAHWRGRMWLFACVAAATVVVLCSGCGSSSTRSTASSAPPTTRPSAVDTAWRKHVSAICANVASNLAGIPDNDGSRASLGAQAKATKRVVDRAARTPIAVPADAQATLDRVRKLTSGATSSLAASVRRAAAGDAGAAQQSLNEGLDRVVR